MFENDKGELAEKFRVAVCVDAETADGIKMYVSASTYVEEYALLLEEKVTEIDEVFTMQFLNKIYGEAR